MISVIIAARGKGIQNGLKFIIKIIELMEKLNEKIIKKKAHDSEFAIVHSLAQKWCSFYFVF